jgi:hypothetical protein
MTGKTIQIYFPSGDPLGIRIADVTTSIVRAIEVPRNELNSFLSDRPEAKKVGVYFLLGDNEEGQKSCYIGQSGCVGDRLKQHHLDPQKDFWNRVLLMVSLTDSWTQTHVTYLEWLCLQQAVATRRYALENGNSGTKPYTPEALQADCETVYETLGFLSATLGHLMFEPMLHQSCNHNITSLAGATGINTTNDPVRIYTCSNKHGANARGMYTAEGFVVLKDSLARVDAAGYMNKEISFVERRSELVKAKKWELKADGTAYVTLEDILYSSPSTASSTMLGAASNGWADWKLLSSGQTLDQIERQNQPPL